MIDPAIVEALFAAWKENQARAGQDRVSRQLPPLSVVKRFTEAAFYASLKTEEGRPLAFSAVLVVDEPKMADGSHRYLYRFSRLTNTIPFTASTIPKIAPAFDPALSSLAVVALSDGDLVCWGTFDHTPTADVRNVLTVGISGSMLFRPDFLTISTSGPGALVFSRGDVVIGRFQSGHFVPAEPTPFNSSSLGGYLIRMFEKTESWRMQGPRYWHFAGDAVKILLSEAARRGHGATIVLLDVTALMPPDNNYSSTHELGSAQSNTDGENQLGPMLNRCAKTWDNRSRYVEHLICTRQSVEELQRIAQLSCVDGALILNSNFDVLSFGATLSAPMWRGGTVRGPDGFGRPGSGVSFDVARYGKRHSSALNFSGACPGSIVFVISQDGPIRAFVRVDESTILWWPDCNTSMSA